MATTFGGGPYPKNTDNSSKIRASNGYAWGGRGVQTARSFERLAQKIAKPRSGGASITGRRPQGFRLAPANGRPVARNGGPLKGTSPGPIVNQ